MEREKRKRKRLLSVVAAVVIPALILIRRSIRHLAGGHRGRSTIRRHRRLVIRRRGRRLVVGYGRGRGRVDGGRLRGLGDEEGVEVDSTSGRRRRRCLDKSRVTTSTVGLIATAQRVDLEHEVDEELLLLEGVGELAEAALDILQGIVDELDGVVGPESVGHGLPAREGDAVRVAVETEEGTVDTEKITEGRGEGITKTVVADVEFLEGRVGLEFLDDGHDDGLGAVGGEGGHETLGDTDHAQRLDGGVGVDHLGDRVSDVDRRLL